MLTSPLVRPLCVALALATLQADRIITFAFCPLVHRSSTEPRGRALDVSRSVRNDDTSFLLDKYRTHDGELLNPYEILKVPRKADFSEIKQSYRNLCRRYHPDVVMHKDILPGSCDNLAQVRDEWERIKLSYEILSDKKSRKRYDRNEVLADPAAALQRAAVDAAVDGIKGVGKGLFDIGAFAISQWTKESEKQQETQNHQGTSRLETNSSGESTSSSYADKAVPVGIDS